MQILAKSIILLMRPHQWLKNLFVFAPLFFGGQLTQWIYLYQAIIVFVAYSFMASSVYCFNDIRDIEADKAHPKKCSRPLASGAISITTAYFTMFILLFPAIAIIYFFLKVATWEIIGITGIYYLMNIAYCVKLKRCPIVDVMIIATGFVLRIFAGGVATGIELSEWIVLMTFLLALFLAFAKRRDDVALFQNTKVQPRHNTNRYNLEFMNQVITSVCTITIVAYIMYCVSPEVTERFHNRYVYLTAIFVMAGIIRYLQLTIVDAKSGSPTRILMKDRFIQICIAGWIVAFLFIIYL